MLLSILIPAFNIEEYIKECIDSLIKQIKVEQMEVIVIDNASTDDTSNILDEYANKFIWLKVLHMKENIGLFKSRHIALKEAKGEYVMFLDGDDYVNDNCIETIINDINNYCPNVILYRYSSFNEKKKFESPRLIDVSSPVLCDNNQLHSIRFEFASSDKINNIWIKCIKRRVLYNMFDINQFSDIKYGEDRLNSIYIFSNNLILYEPKILYNYRLRINSTGSTFKIDRFIQNCRINSILFKEFVFKFNFEENEIEYIIKYRIKSDMKLLLLGINNEVLKNKDLMDNIENIRTNYLEYNTIRKIHAGFLYNYIFKLFLKKKYKSIILISKIYGVLRYGRQFF